MNGQHQVTGTIKVTFADSDLQAYCAQDVWLSLAFREPRSRYSFMVWSFENVIWWWTDTIDLIKRRVRKLLRRKQQTYVLDIETYSFTNNGTGLDFKDVRVVGARISE